MQNNSPLTSIIFLSYDTSQVLREITRASLESIIKYTDEENYELIWIDVIPKGRGNLNFNPHYNNTAFFMGKREDRQWIKIYCDEEPDPGQYACYNRGVKLAKGDYLCFYQNDVFVNEGWLDSLKYYLDEGLAAAIVPDQSPRTRKFVRASYRLHPDSNEAQLGNRDAGLILMTRKVFDEVGGWNENLRIHFGEKDLYAKLGSTDLGFKITCKTMILHLEHAAGWEKKLLEKEKYDEDEAISHKIIQEGT